MHLGSLVANLQRHGFAQTVGGQPNLLVGYVGVLESAMTDKEITMRYGLSAGGWSPGALNPQKYERGTLIVDLAEPHTRRSLWRGAMQGVVQFQLEDAERARRIDQGVATLLERFPRTH